jgi:hypothetical protein
MRTIERVAHCSSVKLRGFSVFNDFFEGNVFMKPNMIKKWSIALLVAAGAAGLTGCEGMRVDDGAATATNNGNIEDRTSLKTNLSGVIVDDFGMPVQGFTVSAYGRTTTSGADGHWVMNDVPVTGVTVNSTAQNLEQTNLSTSGRIYVTYQKEGYATYHSRIDNAQAVITHYGTAGGNPNSIVVSNLVASDRVKVPSLVNSVTGILIDKGTLWDGTVGTYAAAPAGVQVRLVPEVKASETAPGWALYGGSSCQTECGFFGLPEYVTQTDANGAFTFGNVAKLDGGYVLRIDNYGYRASERPNDVAGFSYNWDANNATSIYGGNFTPLSVTQGEWEITDDTLGIGFDVHGSNSIDKLINLGPLYIQDYLVANFNTVEGISVLDQTYNPNDDQGFTQNDGHNALDGATALDGGGVLVDSSIVSNLGTTAPLRFIFSGDMRALADLSAYSNGVIVFDGAGNRVSIDTSKTKLSGRVLELYSTSALTDGTYYVRLHRDVFVDMDAKRLETSDSANAGTPDFDPTDTTNTVPVVGGTDDTINLTDDKLYAEYKIVYTTVDVQTTALSLTQSNITDATRQQIAATGSHLGMIGTELHVIDSTWKYSDSNLSDDGNEDDRLDILYNAMRDRYDDIYDDDGDVVVRTDVATVSFDVTKDKFYRVRVFDPNPSGDAFEASLISVTNVTATAENDLADTDTGVNTGEVLIDNDGNPFAIWQFKALNTGTATVDLQDVGIGYKVAVVKANDFADFAAYDEAMTIELQDDLAPLVALQHSDRSGQDKTNYNADVAPHDSIGMLVEFGELRTDEAGEPINGETKIYYPKLNLTASLYDECHKRAKSENPDQNYDEAQEPQNQTQLDAYYNTTPLLATSKTLGAFTSGKCATLSTVGTTCATGRSDQIYTSSDYSCWYGGTDSVADSCQFYVADPGAVSVYYPVTSSAGGITINSTSTAATAAQITTAMITAGNYEIITFDSANIFSSPLNSALDVVVNTGFKGHPTLGPAGCLAVSGTPADVARNIVIDLTEATASIANSDNTTALQAAYEASGNIAAASTLANDSTGLLHLETPAQHSARAKVYHADTAGSTISSRTNHLIATIGDWRTITETRRYIANLQDINSTNDLLYRAEDYVIDSESDGASEKSILKLHGEKDGDNANLSIAAGHASGVLLVDATPALATSFTVADATVTLGFDQPILDDANYPANSFLDLYGDDFVYRLDIDAETMVRGTAVASVTEDLQAAAVDGASQIDIDSQGAAVPTGFANADVLYAGTKIEISEELSGNADQTTAPTGYAVGATSIVVDGIVNAANAAVAANHKISAGSILAIGTGEAEVRYLITTDVETATDGVSQQGTFVITPPLRTALNDNAAVRLLTSSTHVTTLNEDVQNAAPSIDNADIYPDLPNDYTTSASVVIVNGVVDSGVTAYTDVFGLTSLEFGPHTAGVADNTVTATVTVSGNTMTIVATDTAGVQTGFNASRAGGVGDNFAIATGESLDMGSFFSDLSHNDAQSVLGNNAVDANGNAATPVQVPDLLVDYQYVLDTNLNSWVKVENYDQYDNSGAPQLVGVDSLTCKLAQAVTPMDMDPNNAFLYDVTSSAGISVAAAHGNDETATDADSIYTYDSTAAFGAGNAEDDYPLFYFWGYNNTLSATRDITAGRAVIKLSGVTTIDASNVQAYIYAPANVEIDETITVTEANVETYIIASNSVLTDAGAAINHPGSGAPEPGMAGSNASATVSTTGASAPAILVGLPDYSGETWDSTTDKLVIEDILLDGVPYTLHFSIPTYTTGELTSDTAETDNLPGITVYRKVSFQNGNAGNVGMLADNDDDADALNLRAGNAVTDTFNPSVSFGFREDLNTVTSSISYTTGADPDATSGPDDDRVTFTSSSAAKNATRANQVDLTFNFDDEASTKFIGHGATFTVAATDYDDNSCGFTVTLNLGHGVMNDTDGGGIGANDGAVDADNDNRGEVVSPILNIISGSAVE